MAEQLLIILKSMPTLKKLEKKTSYPKRNKSKEIYDNVYNTKTWRNLRKAYLMEHPLCEECLKQGIVKPASDVHHKYEISNGTTPLEMKDIGFDYNNLQALCEECHINKHHKKS